jgi:hypothetical protein
MEAKDTRLVFPAQYLVAGIVFALYFNDKASTMTSPIAMAVLLAVFFGLFSSPINAQINIKAGYSFSLVHDEAIDLLIEEVNQAGTYDRDYKNLRWVHGFDIGVRFKSGPHAFEIGYLGGYRHLVAHINNPAGGDDLKDKLIFDTESFGLGYQLSDDHFGIGAELQYQFYYTKAKLKLPEVSFKDVQEMWATKLYLMFILEGSGSVTAVIEPYYILPSKGYDPQPLQQFMETTINPSQNKWTRFGLSFLFYNGFQ